MLMAPPATITRTWAAAPAGTPEATPGALEPDTARLNLLVEFPDGFPRPLADADLYVDGKLVSRLTKPPFDTFTWPLGGYDTSAIHTLHVVVEDQLGLKSTSIDVPVQITAPPAPALAGIRIFGLEPAKLLLPAGGVLGGAAVIVAGVFAIRGLRRRAKARPRRAAPAQKPRSRLPMPIPIPARRSGLYAANAPARLVRLTEDGRSLPGSGVAVDGPELTIGSNPHKAAWVLESTSVDGLHARLRQVGAGQYRIFDAGSVAGTWVNFMPAPAEGVLLQHGDRVQLGREALRFELKTPGPARKAVATAENNGEKPEQPDPAPEGKP